MRNRNNEFPNPIRGLYSVKVFAGALYLVAQLAAIIAKLFGWSVSWWWVISPIWLPLAFSVVIFVVVFIREWFKLKGK